MFYFIYIDIHVYICVCVYTQFYTDIHTQMCVYVYSARIFGRAFWRYLPFLLKIITSRYD